jgi:hypothetical protein
MRLYFQRAELLLEKNADGEYVLKMADEILGTYQSERKAVAAYNRIRRDLEAKLPPTELTAADRRELWDRYVADSLVQHNSLKNASPKKPSRSRTFG